MVRKINNRLYKINTYASEMIVEVDDNYDEEVQKLKKEIQLDSLGCKLNLLVYLAELSVQGYAISSVTEFNSNGTKPTVENAISLDNQLNIIQVADLVLPDKDTTFEEYTDQLHSYRCDCVEY